MTLLIYACSPLPGRGPHSLERRDACAADALAAESHAAMIKRFCKFALTIVLFTVVVAGIVALKSAIWIPHLNH